ncbi:hypothetical protein OUZ56_027027 [Daphnia magna]|uniref:Uncharacterized protein n=1 Tax=Daphnia magna TaxID=35525 RepID=A0ABQ9ZNI7_9CRUS|nr:hypothetical protein OUZ56_027027 [Daphnia magna]
MANIAHSDGIGSLDVAGHWHPQTLDVIPDEKMLTEIELHVHNVDNGKIDKVERQQDSFTLEVKRIAYNIITRVSNNCMPESQQTTNNSVQYKYDWNHCVPHYLQPDGLASHHSSNSALLFISAKMAITSFLMCFLAVVMTVAGEPTGYRPAMAYQAPAYKAPAYQGPAYKAPAYKAPAYQPPTYQAPTPKAPAYMAPAYMAPAYMAPAPPYKAAAAY